MATKRTAAQTAELRELAQLTDIEISDLAAQYGVDVANPDTGEAYTREEVIEEIAAQKKQGERKAQAHTEDLEASKETAAAERTAGRDREGKSAASDSATEQVTSKARARPEAKDKK